MVGATARARKALGIFAALLLLAVLVRAALPTVILHYTNKLLADLGTYTGHVGDIDLHLWRGAYSIHDIHVRKKHGHVADLFQAETIDLAIQWRALLHGRLAGAARINQPTVIFIDSEKKSAQQFGKFDPSAQTVAASWQQVLKKFMPFAIDSVMIEDGVMHFRNYDSKPPVEVYLASIDAAAKDLTNQPNTDDPLPSHFELTARAQGEASFWISAKFSLVQNPIILSVQSKLQALPLPRLSSFTRHYGKCTRRFESTLLLAV